jgi:hypothetical protein
MGHGVRTNAHAQIRGFVYDSVIVTSTDVVSSASETPAAKVAAAPFVASFTAWPVSEGAIGVDLAGVLFVLGPASFFAFRTDKMPLIDKRLGAYGKQTLCRAGSYLLVAAVYGA